MSENLTLFHWYFCCLCCNTSRYNKLNNRVYRYGDTYYRDKITGKFFRNIKSKCNIL